MPRLLRVFLCHASQDKPAVRKLHRYLKQHGIKPWLDEIDLLPGENWEVEIPRALNTSDVILVCLSKNSVNKEGYVQREISFALDKALEKPDGTIFIIPARLEDCEVPERLNRYHWVDLFRPDSNKRLLLGLNKRALDLGSDVSPVIVDDTRKRPPIVKPPDQDVLEKAKRAVQEKEERETAERIQRAKDELEAQEKIKREISENAAREKLKRETARLAQEEKEKSGRETAEKNAREKLVSARKTALEKEEREAKSKKQREFITATSRKFGTGGIILLALIFGGFGLNSLIKNLPIATVTPLQDTPTADLSTSTSIPFTPTTQSTKTPIPTPTLGIGSTEISPKDGMVLVYVPAGEFLMGSSDADTRASSDEKPQHPIMVDAFWIDQTEVTNAMYAKCVAANQCDPPNETKSHTRSSYYGNSEFDNYPVIYVSWNDALAYCSWAGRELPTEAQWEKAARGTDGRIYPWGNENPSDSLLNYSSHNGDTTVVKNYRNTNSFYGTYDMAGNVWEWVSSLHQPYPYDESDGRENLTSSGVRVCRGRSWYFNYSGDDDVRSAFRSGFLPSVTYNNIGFRCSSSP